MLPVLVLATACVGRGNDAITPTAAAPIPAADTCGWLGGASTPGTGILNGADCAPERSSVVRLDLRNSSGDSVGGCSGTVVGPRVVLTAAHCLDETVAVVHVSSGSGSPVVAASFVFYPGYRFNAAGFDVGVVRMAEDLPRKAVPILTSRPGRVGETAIVAGWGLDQNGTTSFLRAGSTTLSAVTVDILRTLYAPPSSSVCQGDSGGPIMLSESGTWNLAGITSATSTSLCNTGTNFYQAVRHQPVRDFIRQYVPGLIER